MKIEVSTKGYYVYKVLVEGVCRYVGSGKGNRYLHGTSGVSSVLELNRAYFAGKNLEVEIIITDLSKEQSIIEESKLITLIGIDNLFNKILPSIGLKLTEDISSISITKEELEEVLEYWLNTEMGIVTKAFRKLCISPFNFRSEDWIEQLMKTKSINKYIISFIKYSNHPKIIVLRQCDNFDISRYAKRENFSELLHFLKRQVIISVKLEEYKTMINYSMHKSIIIEKENEIIDLTSKLEEVMANSSWEFKAEKLLSEGVSQVSVAKQLGKGLATIQRFVKKLKLNRSTEDED